MLHTPLPVLAVLLLSLFSPSDRIRDESSMHTNLHFAISPSLLRHIRLFSKALVLPYNNIRRATCLPRTDRRNMMLYSMCLLLLAGDIEDNPGPRQPKFPCGECGKAVTFIVANTRKLALAKTRSKRLAIACDDCNTWFHADCLGMSLNCYNAVAHPDASWTLGTAAHVGYRTSLRASLSHFNLITACPLLLMKTRTTCHLVTHWDRAQPQTHLPHPHQTQVSTYRYHVLMMYYIY